jgi:hypothetical protein
VFSQLISVQLRHRDQWQRDASMETKTRAGWYPQSMKASMQSPMLQCLCKKKKNRKRPHNRQRMIYQPPNNSRPSSRPSKYTHCIHPNINQTQNAIHNLCASSHPHALAVHQHAARAVKPTPKPHTPARSPHHRHHIRAQRTAKPSKLLEMPEEY